MPLPADIDIAALEERACNALPALQSALVGGWLLRFAEGFSKRANSACALPGAAPLATVLPEIEARYARARIRCCLRLTPLAPAGAAACLDGRGWITLDETSLQVADISGFAPSRPLGGIVLSARADAGWIGGYAAAAGRKDAERDTLARMLGGIGTAAAFATVRGPAGEPLSYGMGVLERGMVGLFDIVTPPLHRGQGHGRRVVEALLAWGRAQDARGAYLQVTADNRPALALYDSLGFREAYRYVYRAPA